MNKWVLTGLIVVLIMLLGGAVAMLAGRKADRRERVLSVITRDKAGVSEESKDKQTQKARDAIAKKLKEATQEEGKKKKDRTSLREYMTQAGLEYPVSRFWLASVLFAAVSWGLLELINNWPPAANVFLTFTAFLGVPKWVLKFLAGRRQRKFLAEFADALDGSVRLLQAGMPIAEAIAMVSREYEGPLKDEMIRIYDNQKIGIPLGQAAAETARRVPLAEVHMFATALQIQSETGSSLSEVLSNLSTVIRARFRLKRKVRALSQEAKSSAAIIAALPVLVSLGLYAVNEAYISILFDTTKGNIWLGIAITWMIIGCLIMRQMINFKV
ncbi:MAG: type II secretion system F family protein [Alphaproteobacteria bacterium]